MKTKLHIGCGSRDFGKEWVQIDGAIYPHVDAVIRDLDCLPYKDEAFDLVYASHVISYFDREEIVKVLTEWKRVLKPGGHLMLSVPDFTKLANLYLNKTVSLDRLIGPIFGMMQMDENKIYHKTVYDYESLYRVLIKVGFKRPYLYEGGFDYNLVDLSKFDDHSKARIPTNDYETTLISLNLQATK